MTSKYSGPTELFGELAEIYDQRAFQASPGLRYISEREIAFVLSHLGDINGKHVLDAGVGTGRFAAIFGQRGARVTGIDVTPEMLEVCGQEAPDVRRVQSRVGSKLPFGDDVFDAAICIRVLKYLPIGD